MQSVNALALKEWAVIVHALSTGRQTLLLRKGGLHERHGHFSPEPAEFFLFPTYVHQMTQGVASEAATDLQAVSASQPAPDQLVIDQYAVVEDLVWLAAQDRVAALAKLHHWTPETIAQRFVYGKKAGLYLFVLRVYRLPQAYTLPLLKRYSGCRSWVELAEPLSTANAVPVLSNETFAECRREIRDRLAFPSAAI